MTAQQFQVPQGDPAALRAVAQQLGRLASDHASQLQAFKGHTRLALDGWSGRFGEQYAVAAGHTSGRFTAVSTELKSAQSALGAYAGALEHAQQTVASVNGQLARLGKHAPSSLALQGADALSGLNRAATSCARALGDARSALAVACPDTLTARQLLAAVENAASHIKSAATLQHFEDFLAGWSLFAEAAGGVRGRVAGAALEESKAIAVELQRGRLPAQVARLLEHVRNPDPLLEAWQNLTAHAQEERDAAKAVVDLRGGSFWEGLVKANTIDVAEAGAHAAEQTFLDELARTSRLGLILAPLAIGLGIHDVIYPGNGPEWERIGNRVAGGASIFGGAAALAGWGLGLAGVSWEIPVLDVPLEAVAAVTLTAAGIWALGDLVYNERHTIAHWVGEVLDAPADFVHGLEQTVFNPLDW